MLLDLADFNLQEQPEDNIYWLLFLRHGIRVNDPVFNN